MHGAQYSPAAGFISKLGPRWSLAIGAAGYAPYAAALYTNSAFANQWFLVLGAVICGATSGIFWVTEGTIIMTYSEPEKKGRLLAVWQSLFNLATLIGGGINLGLNIHIDQPGGLSPKTYLVFVALQAIAPLVSLLLSNPKQVQRSDGKPVPPLPGEGFVREFWLTLKELKDPRILACKSPRQPIANPRRVPVVPAVLHHELLQ
jgi:MFS family permease